MELLESKTLNNLARAYAGECQARTRYEFMEYGARKQGYACLAEIIDKIVVFPQPLGPTMLTNSPFSTDKLMFLIEIDENTKVGGFVFEKIDKIVLGYPKNMDNAIGKRPEINLEFKTILEEVSDTISIKQFIEHFMWLYDLTEEEIFYKFCNRIVQGVSLFNFKCCGHRHRNVCIFADDCACGGIRHCRCRNHFCS